MSQNPPMRSTFTITTSTFNFFYDELIGTLKVLIVGPYSKNDSSWYNIYCGYNPLSSGTRMDILLTMPAYPISAQLFAYRTDDPTYYLGDELGSLLTVISSKWIIGTTQTTNAACLVIPADQLANEISLIV